MTVSYTKAAVYEMQVFYLLEKYRCAAHLNVSLWHYAGAIAQDELQVYSNCTLYGAAAHSTLHHSGTCTCSIRDAIFTHAHVQSSPPMFRYILNF